LRGCWPAQASLLKRRIRKLFVVILILFLALAGGLYYVWQQSFNLPNRLLTRVREFARSFHDIDFDAENLNINFPDHTILAKNLKVMMPGEKPFIEAEEATIFLASGSGPLDLYFSRAVIEKIQLGNLKFDATAPKPENASGDVKLLALPAREVIVKGLSLNTSVSVFNIPDFKAAFIRNRNNADVEMSFANGPLGGFSQLKAMLGINTGEASINFRWHEGNFSSFIPLIFLSHRFGLNILSGGASVNLTYRGNLARRIRKPAASLARLLNYELKGNVEVASCSFNWAGLKGNVDLNLNKEVGKPWGGALRAEIGHGEIALSGNWAGDAEKMQDFSGEVACRNLQLNKKIFKLFDINLNETEPGTIDFSGNFSGNRERLIGHGSALAHEWRYQGKSIKSAELTWMLDEDEALTLNGSLKTEIGDLTASTTAWVFGPRKWQGSVSGILEQIDIQKLKPFIDIPFSGRCNGPFKLGFDLQNPASTTYDLKLSMHDGNFYNVKPEELTTRIYGTGKKWNLANPIARFPGGGKIALDGLITSEKFAAGVKVEKVNLALFSVPGRIASGAVSLYANIAGPLNEPVVTGDLFGGKLAIMGNEVESFRSRLSLRGTSLTLSPMVIQQSEKGMLDGFISINILTGDIKAFRLSFQRLPMAVLQSFFPGELAKEASSGEIGGNISYARQNAANAWNFVLEGHKLVLAGENLDSLYLEGSTMARQVDIKSLFIKGFAGSVNLSGQVNDRDHFSGSLEAEGINLNRVAFIQKRFPGLAGELNAQGSLEWVAGERQGAFTVFARDIKMHNRDLGNFGGEVAIDNDGLKISNGEFDKLGLKISGELGWQGRLPYSAKLTLHQTDLTFIQDMFGGNAFEYGGLQATGNCTMQGALASSAPDVIDLQLESLRMQKDNDVIVSNRPLQIIYQNNGVEVRSLELKYRQGVVGVEGVFTPGKNVALMLSGRNFSVKALGSFFNLPNWNYDGSLSAEARLFGDSGNVRLKASAKIEEFVAEGRKIPEIRAIIDGDKTGIDINEAFVKLTASSFNLKGRVDLNADFKPENIDLHVFVPEGPIADLAVYLPQVFREASGTMKADLKLSGKPGSPQIAGDLHLTAGELAFSNMRKPLTNVDFLMSTDDRVINIDRLEASLGRGKLYGTGQVDFRNSLGSISANISGQKLDLSFMNLELSNASASVAITGDLYNPVLHGNVFVPRGKFNLSSELFKKRQPVNFFFDTLNYRFDFEIPRNFWVKSSFLNSEMRGKFAVFGDLEKINLDGGVSCVQGKLYFKQRQFVIETGEINFGGVDNGLDPHIYVKSEGQIQSTRIFLTLNGRISSFTPQIYSTPPMSEGDILALLTLGRNLDSAMHTDTKELFETEILEGLKNSYISALIGNTISTALNLDELFLSSLFDRTSGKSRPYIRVGKYFGKNIFMAYEGSMEQGQKEAYIFEYRLPKGFVVTIEFKEPEQEQQIGVRYDWRFW